MKEIRGLSFPSLNKATQIMLVKNNKDSKINVS